MFSDHFKRIRKKSAKTQKDIAEYLNISAQSISKWETGESVPSINYLPQLAAFLGCSINAFFDEEELSRFEDCCVSFDSFEKRKNFKDRINNAFKHFNIMAEVVETFDSVSVVTYKMIMRHGVGIKEILGRADDIRYYLGVNGVRFITDKYEGKYFSIEIAKTAFDELELTNEELTSLLTPLEYHLPIVLGKDIDNNLIFDDLARLCHLLVAGVSGTGKTTFLWGVIRALTACLTPEELKFVIIDPKKCEFSSLEGNSYLFDDVVYNHLQAKNTLKNVLQEIKRRKQLMKAVGVISVEKYTEATGKRLERIVVLIDELIDFVIIDSEMEELLIEITMKGRSAGVHLIIATALPSETMLPSLILCNVPSRIAYKLNKKEDSVRVINSPDATMLGTRGDMLYSPIMVDRPIRIQAMYTSP